MNNPRQIDKIKITEDNALVLWTETVITKDKHAEPPQLELELKVAE